MSSRPHKHKGYDVVPVADPKTRKALGCFVPMLGKAFLSEGDAHAAIEKRIQKIIQDLRGRVPGM